MRLAVEYEHGRGFRELNSRSSFPFHDRYPFVARASNNKRKYKEFFLFSFNINSNSLLPTTNNSSASARTCVEENEGHALSHATIFSKGKNTMLYTAHLSPISFDDNFIHTVRTASCHVWPCCRDCFLYNGN